MVISAKPSEFLASDKPSPSEPLSIHKIRIYDAQTGKIALPDECYSSVTKNVDNLEESFISSFNSTISTTARSGVSVSGEFPKVTRRLRFAESPNNRYRNSARREIGKFGSESDIGLQQLPSTPALEIRLVKSKTGIPRVVRPATPSRRSYQDYTREFDNNRQIHSGT